MKELHSQGSWFFRHVTSPLDNAKNQLKTSIKEMVTGNYSSSGYETMGYRFDDGGDPRRITAPKSKL